MDAEFAKYFSFGPEKTAPPREEMSKRQRQAATKEQSCHGEKLIHINSVTGSDSPICKKVSEKTLNPRNYFPLGEKKRREAVSSCLLNKAGR